MKIALCFIVSYNNSLNKENVWREWIEPNKDIINMYVHYNKAKNVPSSWIKEHLLPDAQITNTDYFHIIPAYMSLLGYAYFKQPDNMWFCMLTESCVPVVSPSKFRYMFFKHYKQTILRWKKPWWNVYIQTRANLKFFTEDMRFGHDPWFILTRDDVKKIIGYPLTNQKSYQLVCKGAVANESLFAMILYQSKRLDNVLNECSHITNWDRPSSSTSPYIFKTGSTYELDYINDAFQKHPYVFFIRKIDSKFPDNIIKDIITKNTIQTSFIHVIHEWSWCYLIFILKVFICFVFLLYQFRFFIGIFF